MINILNKTNLQKKLFSNSLNRLELSEIETELEREKDFQQNLIIHVYRNHAFEPVVSVIRPFLRYAGIKATFSFSDYDDSFSFTNIPSNADLIVLWIDFNRYDKKTNIKNFIKERLEFLKSKTNSSILIFGLGSNLSQEDIQTKGCYVANTSALEKKLGESLYNERFAKATGTRLSNLGCLEIARLIGLSYIPPIFYPNIKGLVLDLDNTLYAGVLGEDGIEGVKLTKEHEELQKEIKKLKEKGFFLSIASKNEYSDVENLFKKRSDFPLKWEDFSALGISWDNKASNINKIAEKLRIAPDSLLFIDDNIGEIISVNSEIPEIKIILADSQAPLNTARTIKMYPGIFKWKETEDDSKRISDLKANDSREELKNKLSPEEYLKQLKIQISYHINNKSNLARITELGGKTNQFIFSYKRYSEQEIEKIMDSSSSAIIDISLKDCLSDSGLIGVLIAKAIGRRLVIEDLFVSCRALGRGIEDLMILKGVALLVKRFSSSEIIMNYTKGERNAPAIKWLEKITRKKAMNNSGSLMIDFDLLNFKNDSVKFIIL